MKTILTLLEKQGRIGLIGLLILVSVGACAGYLWSGAEATRPTLLGAFAGFGVWAGLNLVNRLLAVRAAMKIERELQRQAQEQIAEVRPDKQPEIKALEAELMEAIRALKQSKMGKGALYALPWYMIVGPPASGKSTALVESGLNFPYRSQGRRGIRGVGGTRNCDWWFTDQGVLLDTAGRYTTELEDREEWLEFLNMLRRARPRKPINGVLVAVSIGDLLTWRDDELADHANRIRQRLDELTEKLELVFPVYLLFTKCDLLEGFVDFFEDMSREDRRQIWGCTLPPRRIEGEDLVKLFEGECRELYDALRHRRNVLLAADRPHQKKRNIYLFPVQFALAQRKAASFLAEVFQRNPYQESSPLRGFYFTSGTQEGAPIDQVVASLQHAFGVQSEAPLAKAPGEKKSYFLYNLFTKVVFEDLHLARSLGRVERRRKLLRSAGLATTAAGFVAGIAWLSVAYAFNRQSLERFERSAVLLKNSAKEPLPARLERLDDLRRKLEGFEDPPSLLERAGLYRGEELRREGMELYVDQLYWAVLVKVEEELRKFLLALAEAGEPPADQKATQLARDRLQAYLMVSRSNNPQPEQIRIDPSLIQAVLFDLALPVLSVEENDPNADLVKRQIRFYAHRVGNPGVRGFRYDEKLADRVARVLSHTGALANVYARIRKDCESGKAVGLEQIFPESKDAAHFIAEYKVPTMFTKTQYDAVVSEKIATEARMLHSFEVAMGRKDIPPPDRIASDLRELYLKDYATEWRNFYQALRIKPFESTADAVRRLKLLAAADSPYYPLFKHMWNTFKPRADPGAETASAVDALVSALREFFKAGPGAGVADADIRWLHEALPKLDALARELPDPSAPGFSKAVRRFARERLEKPNEGRFSDLRKAMTEIADKSPKSVRELVSALLLQPFEEAFRAAARDTQKELDRLWGTEVYTPFHKNLATRYPFDPKGEPALVSDFAALFHPTSGKFRTLYREELQPWHQLLGEIGSRGIEFSPKFLESLDKAEALVKALFAADEPMPRVPFQLKIYPAANVSEITFKLGDQTFRYQNEPERFRKFEWYQGERGDASLRIRRRVEGAVEQELEKRYDHAWGLFSLLDEAAWTSRGNEFSLVWTFEQDGAKTEVRCDLSPTRSDHPFARNFFLFEPPDKVGR